ncbi:MAG: hypothetical protein JSS66_14490 [Armatimonadetes bacterium]|nr:hypothetical protein [Armatimonadota bacterium]MBS1724149.1 hypothetical protein [Armatimonadota bacterium]
MTRVFTLVCVLVSLTGCGSEQLSRRVEGMEQDRRAAAEAMAARDKDIETLKGEVVALRREMSSVRQMMTERSAAVKDLVGDWYSDESNAGRYKLIVRDDGTYSLLIDSRAANSGSSAASPAESEPGAAPKTGTSPVGESSSSDWRDAEKGRWYADPSGKTLTTQPEEFHAPYADEAPTTFNFERGELVTNSKIHYKRT